MAPHICTAGRCGTPVLMVKGGEEQRVVLHMGRLPTALGTVLSVLLAPWILRTSFGMPALRPGPVPFGGRASVTVISATPWQQGGYNGSVTESWPFPGRRRT